MQADAFEPVPELRCDRGVDADENTPEARKRSLDQRARIGRTFGNDRPNDMPATEKPGDGVAAGRAVTLQDIAITALEDVDR